MTKPTIVYAPDGKVGTVSVPPVPVPNPLSKLRIAALDNGKPGADAILGAMGAAFARRTGASFVGVQRKGSAATPCEPDLFDRLRAEADVVLTGTAD